MNRHRRVERPKHAETLLGAASLWGLVYQRVCDLTFPHIFTVSPNRLNPANSLNLTSTLAARTGSYDTRTT